MRKLICILLTFIIWGNGIAQNQIISDGDIPKLDSIIKSLEKDYNASDKPIFYSLPQTTASFFKLKIQTHSFLN